MKLQVPPSSTPSPTAKQTCARIPVVEDELEGAPECPQPSRPEPVVGASPPWPRVSNAGERYVLGMKSLAFWPCSPSRSLQHSEGLCQSTAARTAHRFAHKHHHFHVRKTTGLTHCSISEKELVAATGQSPAWTDLIVNPFLLDVATNLCNIMETDTSCVHPLPGPSLLAS